MSVGIFPVIAQQINTLNFSLLLFNSQQRIAFHQQVRKFEQQNPNTKINIKAAESIHYKDNIESWLQAQSHSDVLYWFGGERLKWYVKQGWVSSINDVWQQHHLEDMFSASLRSSVVIDNNYYGMPISYYSWGIYYRKSLFKQFGLDVPVTWQEFLKVSEIFKKNGITPFALGSAEKWPALGWFDYLNLRLNGIDFHLDLLSGNIPYSDPRVKTVFIHLKELVDKGYFLSGHKDLNWRQSLPYLYRNQAAMLLIGNFWTSQIPNNFQSDFALFRFPQINNNIGWYEDAPTNILIIPANVKNRPLAVRFLKFMSQPEVQLALNEQIGMLTPNINAKNPKDHFLIQGAKILQNTQGVAQFYDRDSSKMMAIKGMEVITDFMSSKKDIDTTLRKLEKIRLLQINAE